MKNYWTQSRNRIFVAAHRGWKDKYPENTMEAFRAAAELGVDQLELDIHVTKDDELVVIHDATVDRTTDGTGPVCEKTLAELKALDAGIFMGEAFRGCRIPTFTEFMDWVSNYPDMTLNLELKEYPTEGHEEIAYSVCDRVLDMAERYGFAERVVINSWSGKLLEYVDETYKGRYKLHTFFPRCSLGELTRDPYSFPYCCCMLAQDENGARVKEVPMAAKAEFDEMIARGVQPWVGPAVKSEVEVDEAIRCGAHLITCNNPDEILAILRKKGYHD